MLCIVVQLCGTLLDTSLRSLTEKRHINKLSLHYQLKQSVVTGWLRQSALFSEEITIVRNVKCHHDSTQSVLYKMLLFCILKMVILIKAFFQHL